MHKLRVPLAIYFAITLFVLLFGYGLFLHLMTLFCAVRVALLIYKENRFEAEKRLQLLFLFGCLSLVNVLWVEVLG